MLSVRVLGELVVEGSSGAIELTGSWRARSLFAWLALNPGGHPRASVAVRFWPDVLDSSARASLRNALWALRRSLGTDAAEALIATRERVGVPGPPVVWVDAASFSEHMAGGRLQEALELCRGDVLAGLDEEWVYQYRDSHRTRLSKLLERLAVEAESAGDLTGAIAWTRERAALDPLAEDAQRALIVRLTRSGNRAGALAAHDRLRERLRRELGIPVSEETRELVHGVREGAAACETGPEGRVAWAGLGRRSAGETPGPEALTPGDSLVGRESELAELAAGLDDAFAGRGRLSLVAGEPGAGKSRLFEELAGRARARGARVLVGRCWEAGGAPAYWPWVQALRAYARETEPEALRAQMGAGAAALAQILPELRERFPDISEPPAREAEGARFRLFEATSGLLRNAGRAHPLVVVLDDLHAADEPSLVLLRFVARELAGSRLLVVGAYRDVDPALGDPLSSTLAELVREPNTGQIALAGLSEAAVGEHLARVTGTSPALGLARAVHARTEGNPLFVVELVRLLKTEGRIAQPDVHLRIPPAVRAVIGRWAGRLSERCQSVLAAASVLGREFDFEALPRLSGLGRDAVLDALDEAMAEGLVGNVHGVPGRLCFWHALIRDTLYDELSSTRRLRLHQDAGQALRGIYAADLDSHHSEPAQHFFATAAASKAIALPPLLKRALAALGDRDSALKVRLLPGLASDPRRRASIPAQRSAALGAQALETARRLDDPSTLAYAIQGYILVHHSPDHTPRRLELATELIDVATRAGDKERILEGHEERLDARVELGDAIGAKRELDEIRKVARALSQPSHACLVSVYEALFALLEGRLDEAEELTARVRGLAEAAQSWSAAASYRLQLYLLRREQGRLDEVEDLVRRSVDDSATPTPIWHCVRAQTLAELGRTGQAHDALDALATHGFTTLPRNEEWLVSLGLLAEAACSLSDAERASILYRLLSPYGDRVAINYPQISTGAVARNLAILAATMDRWDDAEQHFTDAAAINTSIGAHPWLARTRSDRSRMLAAHK